MFPGSPFPVRSETPLVSVLPLAEPGESLGVWLRMSGPMVRLACSAGSAGTHLLLSGDLGILLRRVGRVAVRIRDQVVAVAAERLIGCRALQVVLCAPYLPPPPQLLALYPELRVSERIISLPIGLGSAEEVLAILAAERVPVAASRIAYIPH